MLTREQAIKDSVAIWKWLADGRRGNFISPEGAKRRAVEVLYGQGIISCGEYMAGCPLCELYIDSMECDECPWPGEGICRCIHSGSPYDAWGDDPTPGNAKKVLELVKTFK